jgi:CubicO group peptidase (beta-lactamase class C family)
MQLVSAVLSRETGTSAAEFAQRELFWPLGIHYLFWPADPDGVSRGFADLRLQPRDMAKLGYLWLHHGVWEDKQLVPASYVDAALSPHADVSANVKYGYGLWLYPNGRAGCPAHFEANGNGGQRIAVIPGKDIVMVITGAGLNADDVASLVAPSWKYDVPLAPNAEADAKLTSLVAQAAAPQDQQWAATTAVRAAAAPAALPAAPHS